MKKAVSTPMRGAFAVIFLASLMCLAFGCSDRKRSNPLDPRNEETRGKPGGLDVASVGHDVTVSWDEITAGDVTGYGLYRKREGETDFGLLAILPSGTTDYTDPGLPYRSEASYRFSIRAEGYESPLSDSVTILPGPHQYWVTDLYGGGVFRLTYDGRHFLASSLEDIWPVALAVDSVSRRTWVIDATGYIMVLDYGCRAVRWLSGLVDPDGIEWDGVHGLVWIAHRTPSELALYDTLGNPVRTITGFGTISDLCADPDSGGCWVADSDAGRVGLIRSDGIWSVCEDSLFTFPTALSWYGGGGWLWVADSVSLYRFWKDGRSEKTAEFGGLIQSISSDPVSGNCWALVDRGDDENEVIQAGIAGVLSTTTGFYWAQSIAPDPFEGGCLVADAGHGKIVRLSSDGIKVSEFQGISTPWDIRIENE